VFHSFEGLTAPFFRVKVVGLPSGWNLFSMPQHSKAAVTVNRHESI